MVPPVRAGTSWQPLIAIAREDSIAIKAHGRQILLRDQGDEERLETG